MRDVSEADLEGLLDRPELLVLLVDWKGGRPELPEELDVARLDANRYRPYAARRFGVSPGDRLMLVSRRVILADLAVADVRPATLRERIRLAAGADPADVARRALGDYGHPAPRDAAAFQRGICAVYESRLLPHYELELRTSGGCEHRDSQSGIQGSSSTVRSGSWHRRPDGTVELRWWREDSDVEVGMHTDRDSRDVSWSEYVRVRWDHGIAEEFRFDGDALAGALPPSHTYRRR
jgi:hypothetical protein